MLVTLCRFYGGGVSGIVAMGECSRFRRSTWVTLFYLAIMARATVLSLDELALWQFSHLRQFRLSALQCWTLYRCSKDYWNSVSLLSHSLASWQLDLMAPYANTGIGVKHAQYGT